MRKYLIVFLCLISASRAFANFDYNANCVQAYKNIVSLKLPAARSLIDREKAIHPQNGITILLDNYYDFFKILTTENKAEFDRLKSRQSERMDALDDEDEKSPYYNFSKAEVNLQWALLHSLFGEYATAGLSINKAYRQLQNNQQKFPAFLPNRIPLAVVNILLDALPDGALKSMLSFFGIRGNTAVGVNMLQGLTMQLPSSGYAMYQPEMIFYLTYLQADVLNDSAAYTKMLQYTAHMDSSSLLKSYIQGHTALRTGHSAEAIAFLHNHPQGSEYQPYAYVDYMEGIARLNLQDEDAINYINKFLRAGRSDNYIKDAYLHLAWLGVLDGDAKRYQAFAQLVKTKGNAYIDRDKQAVIEVNEGMPNKLLLQARLYYDGGQYNKALALLNEKPAESFASVHDKAEYYYRLGRIHEALQKDDEAIANYRQVVNIGQHTTYYYAPAAAQKMGSIYERHKDSRQAINCYNQAIAYKVDAVNGSYIQKAKMGLKRIKG